MLPDDLGEGALPAPSPQEAQTPTEINNTATGPSNAKRTLVRFGPNRYAANPARLSRSIQNSIGGTLGESGDDGVASDAEVVVTLTLTYAESVRARGPDLTQTSGARPVLARENNNLLMLCTRKTPVGLNWPVQQYCTWESPGKSHLRLASFSLFERSGDNGSSPSSTVISDLA